MKNIVKIKTPFGTSLLMVSIFMMSVFLSSCDYEFDLPEEGSIADQTPPTANFSATVSDSDFLTYSFANLSKSATDYLWDYGDGNSSTSLDGANTYPGEGTYTITLTASDKLGVTSTVSKTIEVVEPPEPPTLVPDILEAGFEDNSLPDGSGDGRDSWRNSDLGGVPQITSSPVHSGSQAGKFPSAGDRIAYQELTVSKNADYILTYYYTMKESGTGSITVAVLAGSINNPADIAGATIASYEGTDQTSSSTYVRVDLAFNSGDNSTIAIFVSNVGVESRIDDFSIKAVE